MSAPLGTAPLPDLQRMTVCCDGGERSRADFDRLLAKGGFHLKRALPTPMRDLEAFARWLQLPRRRS